MPEALASVSIEEELAACLLPYEVAIGRSFIRTHESIVCFNASPSGDVDADRQLAEALELLALLAHLDWRLWKRVMDKVGGSIACKYRQIIGELRPENVVICLGSVSTWSKDLCEFLVNSSNNTVSSPEFTASKTLILRVLAEQGHTVGEIVVRISGEYRNSDAHLCKTSQLASRQLIVCQEAQRAADERGIPSKSVYCGLRFRSVETGGHPDAALLGYAAEIASCGISLTHLSPTAIQVQEQCPHKFMDAMTKLFPTYEPTETDTARGVNCLNILGFSLSRAYPAFFSAVAASPSVCAVNAAPFFEECVSTKQKRWFWSWFAFGVFLKARGGGGEDSGIYKVSIHTLGLDQDAVDAMAHVLHDPNPVAALFDDEGAATTPEFVSASQFALLDPSSSEKSSLSKWMCDHPVENLPVIERAGGWISVVLPRWGKAWVHHNDVLSSATTAPVPLEIKLFSHVTLEVVAETQLHSVIALLHLIGRGIRHLTVTSGFVRSRYQRLDWEYLVCEVFKACPDLESLKIDGKQITLKTLHRIMDAYSSGSCRLQQLHIQCETLTGGCRSLSPLIAALSDQRHPARRYLKEINLSSMSFSTMLGPTAVPAWVAMLKENKTLQHLHFSFLVNSPHRAQFVDFATQLRLFDNERIFGVFDPRAKLAFLSVVAADRPHAESAHAIQQLDALVLSAIFAFAASSFIRRVVVR